jgi:hypothetical protein
MDVEVIEVGAITIVTFTGLELSLPVCVPIAIKVIEDAEIAAEYEPFPVVTNFGGIDQPVKELLPPPSETGL